MFVLERLRVCRSWVVFIVVFTTCSLTACSTKTSALPTSELVHEITSPAPPGSFSPGLTTLPDASIVLSWLQPQSDNIASLQFAVWRDGSWCSPRTIAAREPFSRHPSTAPGVLGLTDARLIAYWSQKPPGSPKGGNEVDVYFAGSIDGGAHWTPPTPVNPVGTDQENSYPSAATLDDNHAILVWLDGRMWEKQKRDMLMQARVQPDGTLSDSSVLDPDVCTCCPTSITSLGFGLVAAYRGHTPADIRDVRTVRFAAGEWSQPRVVRADNWKIAGCPVNGPSLDAEGQRLGLIWFTAAAERPAVRLAFSENGGADFRQPVRIDRGQAIGRAQVVLARDGSAFALWIENASEQAQLLARIVRSDGTMSAPVQVARADGVSYPHATRAMDGLMVAWVEEQRQPRVHVSLLVPSRRGDK
jgi:hypothetical protein